MRAGVEIDVQVIKDSNFPTYYYDLIKAFVSDLPWMPHASAQLVMCAIILVVQFSFIHCVDLFFVGFSYVLG